MGGGVPSGGLSTTQPDFGTVLDEFQTARGTGVPPLETRQSTSLWIQQGTRNLRGEPMIPRHTAHWQDPTAQRKYSQPFVSIVNMYKNLQIFTNADKHL